MLKLETHWYEVDCLIFTLFVLLILVNDIVNVASNISYRSLLEANVFAVLFIKELNNLINIVIGK